MSVERSNSAVPRAENETLNSTRSEALSSSVMQYLRERLSLNLSQPPGDFEEARTSQDDPPQRPARRVRETPNSPTYSHSTISEKEAALTYVTPYQSPMTSPVTSEKWSVHNRSNVPAGHQLVVQLDKPSPSNAVYVIDHGQFGGYTHPSSVHGGYINHAYANDGGTPNSTNPVYPSQQPPPVLREQYWTWSCKCRRQYTSREKVLLLVICFLLLVIGGLSTYVALISDNGNPLQGGLLTPGGLSQMTMH